MSWHIPGYVHRRGLANGSSGRVVLAVHEATGDLVVIRYLRVEVEDFDWVREDIARASTVDSAYFWSIREYAEDLDSGTIALVTDAFDGVSLRALLREGGALDAEAAVAIFIDSLYGLVAAHDKDIVHGGYRPENVMIGSGGAILVVDAGISRWLRHDYTLGTGVYAAPERWRGVGYAPSSDVYAVTITFYEMFVGEPPFWDTAELSELRRLHEEEVILLEMFPAGLRDAVRLGLAKAAADRADAAALLELVSAAATAEYGEGWERRGRAILGERVALLSLPLAGVAVEDVEDSRTELVELDDYYVTEDISAYAVETDAVAVTEEMVTEEMVTEEMITEETVTEETVVVDGQRTGGDVVGVAEDIVVLAGIERATAEAHATQVADEPLTDEEEAAVAEVEAIVAGGAGGELIEEDVEEIDVVTVAGAVGVGEEDVTEAAGYRGRHEAAEEGVAIVAAGAIGVAGAELFEEDIIEEDVVEEDAVAVAGAAGAGVAGAELIEEDVEEIDVVAVAGAVGVGEEDVTEAAGYRGRHEAAEEGVAIVAAGAIGVAGAELFEEDVEVVAVAGAAGAAGAGVAGAELLEEDVEEIEVVAVAGAAGAAGAGVAGAELIEEDVVEEDVVVAGAVGAGAVGGALVAEENEEVVAVEEEDEDSTALIGGALVGAGVVAAAAGAEEAIAVAGSVGGEGGTPVMAGAVPASRTPSEADTQLIPVVASAGAAGTPPRTGGGDERSFLRRHPWLFALFGIILLLICGGAAVLIFGGPAGGPSPTAGPSPSGGVVTSAPTYPATVPATTPGTTVTASAGVPTGPSGGATVPAGGPGTSATPSSGAGTPTAGTPTASPSTGTGTGAGPSPSATSGGGNGTPTTGPTLPITGIHPIRQMGAVGLTLVAIGIWLMVVFRRRPEKR